MPFEIVIGPRVRKSPFFDSTVEDGVSHFTIYNHMYMPTSYGDPAAEYDRLINHCAMWDVSSERQVEITGPDAAKLAQYLTPRDVSNIAFGQGKYVPLCDHDGTLLNDPILLKIEDDRFWFSIADSDVLLWVKGVADGGGFDVHVREPDVSPLAIQGPKAEDVVASLFGEDVRKLKYFWFRPCELDGIALYVARSGWSKQGGFEIYLCDGTRGADLWQIVKRAGAPFGIGPGAPNYVERVESALLSYGADTDERTNPFEVGLGKYVDLDQDADFAGKDALKAIAACGVKRRQVGLFLDGDPIGSNEHPFPVMLHGGRVGTMSVTAHSPRLDRNIAIALLDASIGDDADGLMVETPQGPRKATITSLPFC